MVSQTGGGWHLFGERESERDAPARGGGKERKGKKGKTRKKREKGSQRLDRFG